MKRDVLTVGSLLDRIEKYNIPNDAEVCCCVDQFHDADFIEYDKEKNELIIFGDTDKQKLWKRSLVLVGDVIYDEYEEADIVITEEDVEFQIRRIKQ